MPELEVLQTLFHQHFTIGVPDSGAEAKAAFINLLTAIEKSRAPLAALWIYDLAMQTEYNVTDSNERSYQLKLLSEANERLWREK